jgi:hypothetical protein
MRHWSLAGSTALATVFMAGAALAQITPEDVWANWQKLGAAQGQTLTATSATRDGDTLVIDGMSIRMDQDGVMVESTIEQVRMRDQGDGTVGITMSDSYPVALQLPSEDPASPDPVKVGLVVSQPGLSMQAAGTAAAPAYSFDAPDLSIRLDSITGGPPDAASTTGELALTGLKGSYLMAVEGDANSIAAEYSAATLALNMAGKDSETQGDVRIALTVADLAGTTNGNLLDVGAADDMLKALADGFATDGSFTYGPLTLTVDATEAGKPTKVAAAAAGGSFNFALDAVQMAYGAASNQVELVLAGADIPFPELKLTLAEQAVEFVLPVSRSDTPQDFRMLLRMVDLVVPDEVWGMVDPAGQLPREPATVIVDAKGKARLTTDLMDEAAMAALGDAAPGELHALDLTELRARIAGAELTGSGALSFDNSDLATFGGVPAPTGAIDLKLTGGNTLLDTLVAMGIVPEEEAMGYRMMISMFANSATDSDTLTSKIEFKDKGIFVNGQRMQ